MSQLYDYFILRPLLLCFVVDTHSLGPHCWCTSILVHFQMFWFKHQQNGPAVLT